MNQIAKPPTLPRKPITWDSFFEALKDADIPDDFLGEKERNQVMQNRDPFEGYEQMED